MQMEFPGTLCCHLLASGGHAVSGVHKLENT